MSASTDARMKDARDCYIKECQRRDFRYEQSQQPSGDGDITYWQIRCNVCGARGPNAPSKRAAIDRWNEVPRESSEVVEPATGRVMPEGMYQEWIRIAEMSPYEMPADATVIRQWVQKLIGERDGAREKVEALAANVVGEHKPFEHLSWSSVLLEAKDLRTLADEIHDFRMDLEEALGIGEDGVHPGFDELVEKVDSIRQERDYAREQAKWAQDALRQVTDTLNLEPPGGKKWEDLVAEVKEVARGLHQRASDWRVRLAEVLGYDPADTVAWSSIVDRAEELAQQHSGFIAEDGIRADVAEALGFQEPEEASWKDVLHRASSYELLVRRIRAKAQGRGFDPDANLAWLLEQLERNNFKGTKSDSRDLVIGQGDRAVLVKAAKLLGADYDSEPCNPFSVHQLIHDVKHLAKDHKVGEVARSQGAVFDRRKLARSLGVDLSTRSSLPSNNDLRDRAEELRDRSNLAWSFFEQLQSVLYSGQPHGSFTSESTAAVVNEVRNLQNGLEVLQDETASLTSRLERIEDAVANYNMQERHPAYILGQIAGML